MLRQRIAYCQAHPAGNFPIHHADHIAKILADCTRELSAILASMIDLG